MHRRTFIYAGAACAALAALGYRAIPSRRTVSPSPSGSGLGSEPGLAQAAPATGEAAALNALFGMTLPDPAGTAHAMSAWAGRPVLINFWATWCGPCVQEMPQLDALQKSHPSVQFIGIGLDSGDNIRAFVRKVPVSYPLLVMDTGGTDLIGTLGDAPRGLPYTILLNPRRQIVYRALGSVRDDQLTPWLVQLTT